MTKITCRKCKKTFPENEMCMVRSVGGYLIEHYRNCLTITADEIWLCENCFDRLRKYMSRYFISS
jgi:RNA polymerase subunit RPABC4/transcription elongation factor Spt4